ncbi:fibrinogen-like protein 1 [Spea bombifrons]|uniref:fibrinogen-like protein 1 n=1 Tax=Spea bombifrons TaxID=233779 RepID=UPI00234A7E2D|nr:fibrinogen-like protein 1 [Spea bombifrons]
MTHLTDLDNRAREQALDTSPTEEEKCKNGEDTWITATCSGFLHTAPPFVLVPCRAQDQVGKSSIGGPRPVLSTHRKRNMRTFFFHIVWSWLLFDSYFNCVQSQQVAETQTPLGYDCSNIWSRNPKSTTGIYTIKPIGANSTIQVFCEMNDDGGWTLIQKHDGQDNLPFDRSWYDYKQGFGNISGEHWLGLDNIYLLTNQEKRISELRVSLGDFAGSEAFAGYSTFNIGPESKFYKLSLGNYSGNAGDAFRGQSSATNQDGSPFSTKDKDNDNCDACREGDMVFRSCSNDQFKSGWWFNSCGIADLNGQWRKNGEHIGWVSAVSWKTWRSLESLKFSKMSVRHN